MNIEQTSVIEANLNCHLRSMFAKYLIEWSIRPACTGIAAMYNALRYSLHVCYIIMLHSGSKSLILDTWLQILRAMVHD